MPTYWDKPYSEDAKSKVIKEYYGYYWYGAPGLWPTPTPEAYQMLKDWRKECIQIQEHYAQMKKEFGKDDPAFAKFCKEEGKFWLRMQRAITLHISWYGEPDKGQEAIQSRFWPLDLTHELDTVAARLTLEHG